MIDDDYIDSMKYRIETLRVSSAGLRARTPHIIFIRH